jgi:uncharacterized protein (DUF362 family)
VKNRGKEHNLKRRTITRREFLGTMVIGGVAALGAPHVLQQWKAWQRHAETFVAPVSDYNADIAGTIREGFREIGSQPAEIARKRILLKPNLVETLEGAIHINTHPLVVRGAIEAFRAFGAAEVVVAEGPGHCRDSLLLLNESGLTDILVEDRTRFVDLNFDDSVVIPNGGRRTRLKSLVLPRAVLEADWVVSLAKMKTHHWVGVTLSMKNLFGLMPGRFYGWPKNVLHHAGINRSILDIYESLEPDFAIVDGIVGMEGDGPIMGAPRHAGVIVMGRDFPAVDATCSRIMGINPHRITYLARAEGWLGSIRESHITQRGEPIESLHTEFALVEAIPAQKGIRL